MELVESAAAQDICIGIATADGYLLWDLQSDNAKQQGEYPYSLLPALYNLSPTAASHPKFLLAAHFLGAPPRKASR